MRRAPLAFALVAILIVAGLSLLGCRDEEDPANMVDLMYERAWREHALKKLNEQFSALMQEKNNNLDDPDIKKWKDVVVPGLIKAFGDFDRDKFNRTEIIKLLAQIKDDRSVPVFMKGLDLKDTSDSSMFQVAANAIHRQEVEEALPKLLDAYDLIKSARDRRPGAPFTNSENEIAQAIISAAAPILVANPQSTHRNRIVEMLVEITDTPDTLQELRLNMKAMKALGRIGDAAAVPVLVRGIAMKGERQPVGLGQIAFAALQQIHDRDAVVDAIIAFSKSEDEAFNERFAKERKEDPLMKNPTWYIQQAVTFLGQLRYPSPKVIEYLMAEFDHAEPDAVDETASKIEGLPVNFEPDGWAVMRRNWAAGALAELGHKPVLEGIKERVTFKTEGKRKVLQLQAEEVVGYVRALGLLQYPEETCDLLLEVRKAADDSMRDKIYYNASLMCGEAFLPDMKKALEGIDCEQIVADRFPDGASEDEEKQTLNECEVIKKRIQGYMDRLEYAKECGEDLDCHLKTIADHTNKNVERAIWTVYRVARDDPSKRDKVVGALIDNLDNPSKVALEASIRALDFLTPEGGDELVSKIQEVYRVFARQATYKDRARDLEAFIGRVRNRGRK